MDEKKAVIVGDFNIVPANLPAEGTLALGIQPIDMVTYWRRCSAVANFIADFYKKDKGDTEHENLISTVFNELIENASKYSTKRDSEIYIDLKLYNTVLLMQIKNVCNKLHYESLKHRLEKLLDPDTDLEELYVSEMEKKTHGDKNSGIGLLMLLKDYHIQIGAKFELFTDDLYNVTVQVYYFMEEN